jgi:hypothetical protein
LYKLIHVEILMSEIFKVIAYDEEGGENKGISIGIDLQIVGRTIPCPITGVCRTYEELSSEVAKIEDGLKRVAQEGKGLLEGTHREDEKGFTPDMLPEEIWSALLEIEDEAIFIERFNGLEEEQRREVAEYVLTKCNIFSGKPSLFAARYNASSGLMG